MSTLRMAAAGGVVLALGAVATARPWAQDELVWLQEGTPHGVSSQVDGVGTPITYGGLTFCRGHGDDPVEVTGVRLTDRRAPIRITGWSLRPTQPTGLGAGPVPLHEAGFPDVPVTITTDCPDEASRTGAGTYELGFSAELTAERPAESTIEVDYRAGGRERTSGPLTFLVRLCPPAFHGRCDERRLEDVLPS